MESLPSTGYLGADVYPYFKHHNTFAFLTDVVSATGQPTAQAANIVSFSQLATDRAANAMPSFGFIVPNALNDAHDCPNNAATCPDTDKLTAADNWLRSNIDPLITSPAFANSVLIITFDEGQLTDLTNIGGQVATVIVGTHVKSGFRSTTMYQHQSTLRLVLDLLRVGDRPGLSSTASSMNEFFL